MELKSTPESAPEWTEAVVAHLRAMKAQGAFENRPALPADKISAVRAAPELDEKDKIKPHFHIFAGSDSIDIPSLVRTGLITNVPTAVIKHQFDSWAACFDALYDDALFAAFLDRQIDTTLRALRERRVPNVLNSFRPENVGIPGDGDDKPVFTPDAVTGTRPNYEGSIDALTDNEALWVLHVMHAKPDIALTFGIFKEAIEEYGKILTTEARTQAVIQDGALTQTDAHRLEMMADNITTVMNGPFWDRMIMGRFCLLYAERTQGDLAMDVKGNDFRTLIDYLRGSNFRGQAEQMDHNLRHVFRCPFHGAFNRLAGWGQNLSAAYQKIHDARHITHRACQYIVSYTENAQKNFLAAGGAPAGFLPPLAAEDGPNKRRGPGLSGPPADAE